MTIPKPCNQPVIAPNTSRRIITPATNRQPSTVQIPAQLPKIAPIVPSKPKGGIVQYPPIGRRITGVRFGEIIGH